MKYEDRWKKKMLIYLYEYFNHKQELIIDEFCSRKLYKQGLTKDLVVDKYFKEHKIKLNDYITMVDKDFIGSATGEKPVLVYKKGEEPESVLKEKERIEKEREQISITSANVKV